jgi:hypothetical protein
MRAKGLSAKDICKEIFPVYGGKCLSCKMVHKWVKKFSHGRSKVTDQVALLRLREKKLCSRWKSWFELTEENDSEATTLGCSHGSAYSIMHDRSKFWKVCTQGVPKELKDWEKINWMGLSLQYLLQYTDEGENMLNRIVTGDESWVHLSQPEPKHASMRWKHPSSPSTKKF